MRSYSSGLRPVLGDQLGGDGDVVADHRDLVLSKSGGAAEWRDQALEQAAPVGAAHEVFDVIFRMRHHAEHVDACSIEMPAMEFIAPLRFASAVDACRRASRIAEDHQPFAFEPRQRLVVGGVVALAMRDADVG